MKIQILTAMYGRPEVSRKMIAHTKWWMEMLLMRHGIGCEVFASVSGADSVQVCEDLGVDYIEVENNPLGLKWNRGLQHVLENKVWDYLLILGDDDFLHYDAIACYVEAMKKRKHYVGFGDLYFVEPAKLRALYYSYQAEGYHQNKTIGAGRLVSRQAIEAAAWKCEVVMNRNIDRFMMGGKYVVPVAVADWFYGNNFLHEHKPTQARIWRNDQNKGLDAEFDLQLVLAGYPPLRIETEKPVVLDWKTETNIWRFSRYQDISKEVEYHEVMAGFGLLS
jgi:hypothetical protein